MRLCTISTFPPMRCGIGEYVFSLMKYMRSRGVECHILTFAVEGLPLRQELDDGTVVWRIIRRFSERQEVFKLINQLEPEVVHIHSAFIYPASFYSVFLNWGKRAPLVVTAHEIPSLVMPYWYPLFYLMYSATDKVITLTIEGLKSLVKWFALPYQKVVMFPHGCDVNLFPNKDMGETFRKAFGISSDTFLIVYFGFIRSGKGIEYLLKAYSLVAQKMLDSKLIVAGGMRVGSYRERAYLSKSMRLLHELKLENSVIFTGYLNNDMKVGCLSAADLIVLPYERGSFLKSGQASAALATGCAIVATKITDVRMIFRNRFNSILVPPRDASELAKAILKTYSDPQLRERLGSNARLSAENLSLLNVADKYISLYHEVLRR